jgi:hypothetical protein
MNSNLILFFIMHRVFEKEFLNIEFCFNSFCMSHLKNQVTKAINYELKFDFLFYYTSSI